MQPFDRSGIAALSDLETSEWAELFNELEGSQSSFLAKEQSFRSPEYKWPRDPLHWWSRVWEYPYVYHHLKNWRKKFSLSQLPRVVDLGSGVTFFPFSVARLGYSVICTDIDPICGKDLNRAAQCISSQPGIIDFMQTDGISLPFHNKEMDVVYCISVLEHITHFERIIQEIARVLSPGGLLLLTVDIDLRGGSQLGPSECKRLTSSLKEHFDYLHPETTIHPYDMLHSGSGPYAYQKLIGRQLIKFIIINMAKMIIGERSTILYPFELAVHGLCMRRK